VASCLKGTEFQSHMNLLLLLLESESSAVIVMLLFCH
jgi:hypothetical protein